MGKAGGVDDSKASGAPGKSALAQNTASEGLEGKEGGRRSSEGEETHGTSAFFGLKPEIVATFFATLSTFKPSARFQAQTYELSFSDKEELSSDAFIKELSQRGKREVRILVGPERGYCHEFRNFFGPERGCSSTVFEVSDPKDFEAFCTARGKSFVKQGSEGEQSHLRTGDDGSGEHDELQTNSQESLMDL